MSANRKDLDKEACKEFVCPNLSLIDKGCEELGLGDKTTRVARDLAIEYFKRTYREPHYSSAKPLLPAFVYIASIFENERRTQWDIENAFGITSATIRKWYRDIAGVLDIKIKNGCGIGTLPDHMILNKHGNYDETNKR